MHFVEIIIPCIMCLKSQRVQCREMPTSGSICLDISNIFANLLLCCNIAQGCSGYYESLLHLNNNNNNNNGYF